DRTCLHGHGIGNCKHNCFWVYCNDFDVSGWTDHLKHLVEDNLDTCTVKGKGGTYTVGDFIDNIQQRFLRGINNMIGIASIPGNLLTIYRYIGKNYSKSFTFQNGGEKLPDWTSAANFGGLSCNHASAIDCV